ncbi:MAG: septum formation initiator family protein [Ignavibacteriaceae bacterium]|nr:septum formation initiator family protein [Ignavibacteriaceae bacterium]
MSFLKKINIKFTLVLIVIFAATMFLLFNNFGLIKYMQLQKEVSETKMEMQIVNEQNRLLKNEVDSLERKVPAKIEKTAREKYGMIRKGEKVIDIKTK